MSEFRNEAELIEKVARAICASDEQHGGHPWDEYKPEGHKNFRACARAVIPIIEANLLRYLKENLPTAQFALTEYYDQIARERGLEIGE